MHNYPNMQTRSQSKIISNELEFIYDFDAASEAWKANKKRGSNCTYTYVCQKQMISGNFCQRKCLASENFCSTHLNKKL